MNSLPALVSVMFAQAGTTPDGVTPDPAAAAANEGTVDGVVEGTSSTLQDFELPFYGAEYFNELNILHRPQELIDYLVDLPWIFSAVMVFLGVLCILNGYRWHKWVIASLAFLAGIFLGQQVAESMGRPMIVAIALGALFAIVTAPLLRVTVAIFAGLAGAFIGTNAWTAAEATTESIAPGTFWAGGAIGFIVMALLSMLLFRLVVVVFTSVGGAALVVFGVTTLLMLVEGWAEPINSALQTTPLMIPLLTLLAAVAGFVVQEGRLRNEGVRILDREPPRVIVTS